MSIMQARKCRNLSDMSTFIQKQTKYRDIENESNIVKKYQFLEENAEPKNVISVLAYSLCRYVVPTTYSAKVPPKNILFWRAFRPNQVSTKSADHKHNTIPTIKVAPLACFGIKILLFLRKDKRSPTDNPPHALCLPRGLCPAEGRDAGD